MTRTANSSDGRHHAPVITPCSTTNSSTLMNVGEVLDEVFVPLQSISSGRSLTSLGGESLWNQGFTAGNLLHDWMAVCREVSYEDKEFDDAKDDNYDGDDDEYHDTDCYDDMNNCVLDGLSPEEKSLTISNFIIGDFIEDLGCEENQLVASLTTKKTKKKKTKPKRIIDLSCAIEPTDNDILFGRGSKSNKHPGNIRFREKARELGSWYISCSSKEEKYEVSKVLVNFIKGENCRFLEKGPHGLWYKVIGNGARKKASQALRDESKRGKTGIWASAKHSR